MFQLFVANLLSTWLFLSRAALQLVTSCIASKGLFLPKPWTLHLSVLYFRSFMLGCTSCLCMFFA